MSWLTMVLDNSSNPTSFRPDDSDSSLFESQSSSDSDICKNFSWMKTLNDDCTPLAYTTGPNWSLPQIDLSKIDLSYPGAADPDEDFPITPLGPRSISLGLGELNFGESDPKHCTCMIRAADQDEPKEAPEPTEFDVVYGRGKGSYMRPGNRRLKAIATEFIPAYIAAKSSKHAKGAVLDAVMERVTAQNNGNMRFLKQKNGRWYEMPIDQAREKVGHTVRECMHAALSSGKHSPSSGAETPELVYSPKTRRRKSNPKSLRAAAKQLSSKVTTPKEDQDCVWSKSFFLTDQAGDLELEQQPTWRVDYNR